MPVTIDDLTATVIGLTNAQTALLDAVNVQKSFIDNAVTSSGGSATGAAASAASALTSKNAAATSATGAAASAAAAAVSQADALSSKNSATTNAASTAVNTSASLASKNSAAASAAAAASSANSAAANTNAVLWVSGTTYALGFLVYSPLNQLSYRRKTAGAGAIDPSLDLTNWGQVALDITTGMPTIQPSLVFDFAKTKMVPSRITFSRNLIAPYWDALGLLRYAAPNVPRIDHNPLTKECLGFLIEEARINRALYSNDFSNAVWAKTRASLGALGLAPNGTMTMGKLVEDTTASLSHYFVQSINFTINVPVTFFVVVRPAERSLLELRFTGGAFSSNQATVFDLIGKTTTAAAGNPIVHFRELSNGNFECGITATPTSTASATTRVSLHDGATVNYTGDGTSGLYLFEAQCQDGLFPTSLITTTASTVTRPGDNASLATTNTWYNQDEGTFTVNAASFAKTDIDNAAISFASSSGTASDFMSLISNTTSPTTGAIRAGVTVGTVAQTILTTPVSSYSQDGTFYRAGIAYAANNVAFACDLGQTLLGDSTATIPAVTTMYIGAYYTALNRMLNGHVKSIRYYPKRISNSELQALVS